MTALAAAHPARDRVRLWVLLFGVAAAPLLWLAQLILSYGVSAVVCYRGDHPTTIASGAAVRTALLVFDAVALVVALAAAMVSYSSWRAIRSAAGADRARFMALWGIMSSACFLGATVVFPQPRLGHGAAVRSLKQILALGCALVALALALAPPLSSDAQQLLSFHMLQHLLLIVAAAPHC